MTKKVERSDESVQEEPKLPHERDQQPASQSDMSQPVTEVGEQAHEDLSRGLVDTDKGPAMDRANDRNKR